MSKYVIFRLSLLSCLFGVIYSHYISVIYIVYFLLILATISFAVSKHRWHIFWVLLFFLIGFFRVYIGENMLESNDLLRLSKIEKNVVVQGIVSLEPELKGDLMKYTLSDIEIDDISYNGDLQFKSYPYPSYKLGQHLKVEGLLYFPTQMDGFDYPSYLKMKGVYALLKRPTIVESGKIENSFYSYLFKFKNILEKRTIEILSNPHDVFLNGLLYGSRDGLPQNVQDDFQVTGLTHIIAISGYNITLIISISLTLLCFLPRKWKLVVAGIFIIVFTIFVGADASVIRACIMGVISLVALHTGRNTAITTTLLFVAASMVMYNWRVLFYDVGFQLSFAATCGLVYFSPILLKYLDSFPEFLSMKESLLMTISAQITTVPVIIYHFEKLSIVSPLANLIVAPFIPIAMLFGFIGVVVSFISNSLGMLLSMVAYFALEIVLKAASLLADLSFANVNLSLSFIWIFIYYIFIFFLYLDANRQSLRKF